MNKRCIIITAYIDSTIRANINIRPDDYIICADGGFVRAREEGITPNVVIGDFDSVDYDALAKTMESGDEYSNTEVIKTRPEKDDTDTLMCVNHALDKGLRNILLIGGLGGRLDHTMANIQTLSHIIDMGGRSWILDNPNKATMLEGPDEITLNKNDSDYFSIYSYSEKCTGIYEINAKYPLDNATLTQSFPLGTSNEFLGESSTVKVGEGKVLIITSRK